MWKLETSGVYISENGFLNIIWIFIILDFLMQKSFQNKVIEFCGKCLLGGKKVKSMDVDL